MTTALLVANILSLQSLQGHWSGAFSYKGSDWPVDLIIDKAGRAQVSLPELLYYNQPASTKTQGGKTTVEFPFGLGELPLTQVDGKLSASIPMDDGQIRLSLKKTDTPNLVKMRDITFKNGGLTFQGTIYSPAKSGRYPAAVQVHGSIPRNRKDWMYSGPAYHMASKGVAVLIYDKRPYTDIYPDIADLASDAKAAYEFLKTQPEVDPNEMGFTGGSQAGWIIGTIAQYLKPAWILGTSLPANSIGENEIWVQKIIAARQLKATPAELQKLDTYLQLFFLSARTGNYFPSLMEMGQAIIEEKWASKVEIPTEPSHLDWWRRNMDYGTDRLWQGIDAKTLVLYGQKDVYVDPYGDPARLQALLPNVATVFIPGADHRLELPAGMINGSWRWPQMAPAYFENVDRFLKLIVNESG